MKLYIFLFYSILAVLASCCRHKTLLKTDTPVTATVGDTVKELGNNIMLVYQDQKNNYWFGSWESGLYRYDGKIILHFTTKSGLPHNRVEEIKEDHIGNIYINTSKGISKFDGQTLNTLSLTNSENQWKLEPNDLWFRQGWDSGFVYRYDGHFLYKLQSPKHPIYSDPCAVYSIYKDSKGTIWFGTNPLGVYRYNGKSIDWIAEEDVTELHNGPANGVRSIIEDKDGYFWFNTMYRYKVHDQNKDGQSFYSKEKSIGSLDGKIAGDLTEYLSVAKDNTNDLWFATYRDGIWHYNGKRVVHYPVNNGTKNITVFSIYKDNFGMLWLGTHENGAFKFNGQTFERFNP